MGNARAKREPTMWVSKLITPAGLRGVVDRHRIPGQGIGGKAAVKSF